MEKRGSSVFLKILTFAIMVILANVFIFVYKSGNKGMTGFAIGNLSNAYTRLSSNSKIFLLVQWALLVVALAIGIFIDANSKKKESKISESDFKKMAPKFGTDLDTLYNLLKSKKKIRLSVISKAFKVNKDIAMSWAKTLESGNLASIEYPGIGEPVIKFTE